MFNKSTETNQKPAGGFLIAHFKRYTPKGNMLKNIIYISLLLILTGCAEKSGVYPSGQNTYAISNQAATGFSGLQDIKSEAYQEASGFCQKQNKDFEVVNIETTKPPYILGNYPRVDIRFKCISN